MVPTEDDQARTRPRAVIASGGGRYADPWHPYPETTPLIADVLRGDGWDVVIGTDPDAVLAALDGFDLLVVNAGDPWRHTEARVGADPAAQAGLDAALARGIGVLALHSSLSSLRDYPAYRAAVGGVWEPGRSWHPKIGDAVVHPAEAGSALLDADFAVFDEQYADLVVDPDATVHAVHEIDGVRHPAVWTREGTVCGATVRGAVSSLGHDARAYDSPAHRALLARLARWAGGRDV